MSKLKIATCPFSVGANIRRNAAQIKRQIVQAKKQRADVYIFRRQRCRGMQAQITGPGMGLTGMHWLKRQRRSVIWRNKIGRLRGFCTAGHWSRIKGAGIGRRCSLWFPGANRDLLSQLLHSCQRRIMSGCLSQYCLPLCSCPN
mgnify:CR=1 FL=1